MIPDGPPPDDPSPRYIASRFKSRFFSDAARIVPFIASCVLCVLCLVPAGRSWVGDAIPTLAPLATGICGLLALAWLRNVLLKFGLEAHVTLRDARWFLLLKASSYYVVMAACMYMYEGRNPAASLLCWFVMTSVALDHTVFDPGFAAVQIVGTAPLLLGMRQFQAAGRLAIAALAPSTWHRVADPGLLSCELSSERLLLSALLALALVKVTVF